MARIILMFKEKVIKEFPCVKDSMVIGRKPDNDIIIDNLAVSGHHARIDKTKETFVLTDLQSTNGTFVNDKKVFSHTLKHGDRIQIGKHTFVFLTSEKDSKAEVDLDRTMMLDTARHRELLSRQEVPSPVEQKPEKIGILTCIDGSGLGEIELTKKLTRMGKSDRSEIKLSGLFIGSTAATISRRSSGYTITFTGSLKKLKVNGQVVKDSTRLKDFDTIEIGSHKFKFYQKDVERP
jgi:pSer/pThr/pTyr-binding forkhead associated (FHA) protein